MKFVSSRLRSDALSHATGTIQLNQPVAGSHVLQPEEVILHPSTSLGHRPEWIVFHELCLSSKLFIKTGLLD